MYFCLDTKVPKNQGLVKICWKFSRKSCSKRTRFAQTAFLAIRFFLEFSRRKFLMAVFIAARLTVPIENLNMWLELRVFVLPSPSQEGVSQQCVPLLCKFDFKLTGRKPRLYLYHFVKLRLTVLFVLIHVLTLTAFDCSFCLDTRPYSVCDWLFFLSWYKKNQKNQGFYKFP